MVTENPTTVEELRNIESEITRVAKEGVASIDVLGDEHDNFADPEGFSIMWKAMGDMLLASPPMVRVHFCQMLALMLRLDRAIGSSPRG